MASFVNPARSTTWWNGMTATGSPCASERGRKGYVC